MKRETTELLRDVAASVDAEAKPSEQEILRGHVMERFDDARKTNNVETCHTPMRYIPRIAAALLIGAAVAGGVWLLIGDGGPSTVHAQVLQAIEKSKQAKWVQYVDPANPNQVFLNSFKPMRAYSRYNDGRISAVLPEQNINYNYAPISNTLEITYQPPSPIDRAGSVFEMMTLQLKQFSLEWQKSEGEDPEGRKVWFFSSEHPQSNDSLTIQLSVDPATERVMRVRMDFANSPERSIDFPLAYPESGPADIYEFGVPRDAKVVDYTPSEQVFQLSKTLFANNYEGLAPAYRTVVVRQTESTFSPVEVFYRQGKQFRHEYYNTSRDADWAELAEDPTTLNAEAAHRWLDQSQPAPVATSWFEIDDELKGLHPHTVEYQTWNISNQHQLLYGKNTDQLEDDHLILTHRSDPYVHEGRMVKYPNQTTYRYDLSRGGMLAEYRTEIKSQFPWLHDKNWMSSAIAPYYDPDHHQVNSIRILESKQSPTGKWYATRIERIFPKNGNAAGEPQKTIVTIFVDFEIEPFEPGFFDDPEKP